MPFDIPQPPPLPPHLREFEGSPSQRKTPVALIFALFCSGLAFGSATAALIFLVIL